MHVILEIVTQCYTRSLNWMQYKVVYITPDTCINSNESAYLNLFARRAEVS